MEITQSLESDEREACDKIASIISSLYDRHGLAPLNLRLGTKPDFRNGGVQWDGKVHLTMNEVIHENPYLDPDYRDRLLRLFPPYRNIPENEQPGAPVESDTQEEFPDQG